MKIGSDFRLSKYGLDLRLVNEDDADFIVKLRTDPILGRYLHTTSTDVEVQKQWIRDYKKREAAGKEYYFIFLKNDKKIGLNRIYHIEEDRFTSGSWVFIPDIPFEYAISSALIVRSIAFDILGKIQEFGIEGCHINNKKVIKFNLMLGLKIKGKRVENGEEFYTFNLSRDDFEINKQKIEKLIGF